MILSLAILAMLASGIAVVALVLLLQFIEVAEQDKEFKRCAELMSRRRRSGSFLRRCSSLS